MNKTHCLIWNDARQTWIVTHENAARCGKPASRGIRLLALLVSTLTTLAAGATPSATALPVGVQVVAGQATVSQNASAMRIQQGSDKAILNWTSFNVGSHASVYFQQPSSSSIALNRVLGGEPSSIYGKLNANGQVFLVNPSGVLFGKGASVNVGGLVASTLAIRDEDFLANSYRFQRALATGSVINQGEVAANYVALLAPEVRNEGVVVARRGTVALAAGEAITLGISGNHLVDVQVEKASIDTLIENRHLIVAEEGTVLMSAQSAHSLLGRVVNSGVVDASGMESHGGTVRLTASSSIHHSGDIDVSAVNVGTGGTAILLSDLDNSASQTVVDGSIRARGGRGSGDGGFVETSATRLTISDSSTVDTRSPHGHAGQWLLDPYDFTIAATGGDITGTALSNALVDGNVTIQTTQSSASCIGVDCSTGSINGYGDITVSDNVSWGTHSLTLDAWRHIDIRGKLSVTGTGGLALLYGQGSVTAGNGAMLRIGPAVDLASSASFQTKFGSDGALKTYTVISDLGAEGSTTNTDLQGITALAGNYVLGTDIDATAAISWNRGAGFTPIALGNSFTGSFEGLGHTISNLTINRSDNAYTGLFSQIGSGGIVQNIHIREANVANSYTTGSAYVGILAGRNAGTVSGATTRGTVSTAYLGGGLIGGIGSGGVLERSSTAANVTGGDYSYVGGLAGLNYGTIRNVFATGNVTGVGNAGPNAASGLVGDTGFGGGTITNAYASGAVSGSGTLYGFVGAGSGAVTNGFYNSTTTGRSDTRLGSQPKTSAEMLQQATFNGWDFNTLWKIGVSGPVFQLGSPSATQLYVRLIAGSSLYGTDPALSFAYYDAINGGTTVNLSGAVGGSAWSTTLNASSSAGNYSLSYAGNLAKDGYEIAAGAATTWIINRKPLDIAVSKTYDSSATFSNGFILAGVVGSDTVSVSGNASVASPNASNYASFASSTLSLSNNNYTLTGGSVNAVINPKRLDISVTKEWNGSTSFTSGFNLTGIVGNDSVLVTNAPSVSSADPATYTSFSTLPILSNTNYTLQGGSVNAVIEPEPYFTGTRITTPRTITGIGTVTGGRADFTVSPASDANSKTVTVSQTAANGLYLIWSDFTVPLGYTLNFIQSTSGVQRGAHNSITSSSPAQFWGKLQSNGPVYFYAPAGIVFAPFASLNVGSLSAIAMSPVIPATSAGTITLAGPAGNVKNEAIMMVGKINETGQTLLRGSEVINDGHLLVAGNSSLTLQADSVIRVNAPITLAGSGTLAFNGDYQLAVPVNLGASSGFSVRGVTYSIVTDLAGLRNISGSGNYALGNDIDASATLTSAFSALNFSGGTLAGLGHTVSKLKGNGFIGGEFLGTVRDIGLVDADMTLTTAKGGFVSLNRGIISNSFLIGKVHGGAELGQGVDMGGFVGENRGAISKSFFSGTVTGTKGFGGFIYRNSDRGTISNSFFSGSVDWFAGPELNLGRSISGFVHDNRGKIENSYFTGTVKGLGNQIAGFAIFNLNVIKSSFFSGSMLHSEYTDVAFTNGIVLDPQKSKTNEVSVLSAATKLKAASYPGLDFNNIWMIEEGVSTPWLRTLPRPIAPLLSSDITTMKSTNSANREVIYRTVAAAMSAALTTPATVVAQNKYSAAANALTAMVFLNSARQDKSTNSAQGQGAINRTTAIDFAKQAITAYCPKCTFSDADYLKWVTGK